MIDALNNQDNEFNDDFDLWIYLLTKKKTNFY